MPFFSLRVRVWAVSLFGVVAATAVISATTQGDVLSTGGNTDDVRANTTTTGVQASAAVARDAVGNYVVVWAGEGGSGLTADSSGIFLQRYDHNGTAQGSETRVNTTTNGTQQNPAVAMDAAGNFVVAWETCASAGLCDVAVQRYNAAGQAQGLETTVNTTTCGDQSRPAVAMSAAGAFVVAWQSNEVDAAALPLPCSDPSGYDIVARQYSAAGLALAGEIAVNTINGFAQQNPSVAMDVNGNFVVAWQSTISGSGQDVQVQAFAAAGTPAGVEFRANATTADDQQFPAIAMTADGDFTVVWQGPGVGNDIYMRRFDSGRNAQTVGDEVVNATTAGDQTSPAVAVDASGDIVVAWEGVDAAPSGIFYQRFNAAGVAQGGEKAANKTTADDQAFPAVAADADGDFVIAWESNAQDGDNYGVYLRRFTGPEAVDLSLIKTDAADPVATGANFSYELIVTNNAVAFTGSGDDTVDAGVRTATGITVTDTLPAGVAYVSSSGTGWSCALTGNKVSCALADAVAPGQESAPLTLTVQAPAGNQQVVNSATVSGDQYDPTVANDTGTQATWICAGGSSGTLQLAAATYSVGEDGDDAAGNDDGKATLTISRGGSTCGDATVEVSVSSSQIGTNPVVQPAGTATAGQDYTAITAQAITLANGEASKTFDVEIIDDVKDESDETFNVQIANPTRATLGAQTTSRVTITDNDATPTVALTVTGSPFTESGGTATITATLSAASGRSATINLNFGAGSSANARYGASCTAGAAEADADYSCSAASITIPAGSTTGSVTLTGLADTRDEEDNEPVVYAPACDANCTWSGTAPTVQVADDDAAPTVQFQAATSSVAEDTTDGLPPTTHGNTDTINVTLSAASDRQVSVAYAFDTATGAGKATAGTDYTTASTSGVISFAPHTPGVTGETTKPITLTTVVDTTHESNETAAVTLSAPVNATLGTTKTHTATITDNDAAPTVNFNPATATVNPEGNAGASTPVTVTAVLSAVSGVDVTVPFGVGTGNPNATNPADHNAAAGTIMIPAGQTSGTYTFDVAGDVLDEGNEQVVLTMGMPTGASAGSNATHTTTITDDDPLPVVSIDTADAGYTTTKSEAGGTVTVVLKLAPVSGRSVTVAYALTGTATNGSDYSVSPASPVTFAAGETSKTLTVTLINDTADEANSETMILTLQNPTNGSIASSNCSGAETSCKYTLSITDDDDVPQVAFTAASSSAAEDAVGARTARVQLSRASSSDITIPFTVGTEPTAAQGGDYTLRCPDGAGGTQLCNGEITIAAGTQSGDITFAVVGDKADEADETITVTLASGAAYTLQAPTTHTHTIQDDDAAGITLAQSSGSTNVAEGSATDDTYTLVLTSQPTADVTITLSHGAQVGTSPNSVTFTSIDWNTPKTITVSAVDDAVAEGPHTDTITHSVGSGDLDYSGRAVPDVTVNVTDNDSAGITLVESGGSTVVTEGGATDSYTIVLNTQPTADVVINLAATQVLLSSNQLTFTTTDWNMPQTVTVTADDDDVAEGAHAGLITHTVSSADGTYDAWALRDVTPSITDDDTAGVVVTESGGSTATTEGGATDSYTIVLSSQPTADVTVDLSVGAQATVNPVSVTFNAVNWNLAVAVTVTAVDDSVAEGAHGDVVAHAVSSTDTTYDGIAVADVNVAIADNETAGITLTQSGGSTDVTEGGATDSYTLVLTSEPTADVTITLSGDADVDAAPVSVTFTSADWDTPQAVTVTAVDDAFAEGAHTGTISHSVSSADAAYDGQAVPNVTANITDDETAGVTVTESGGSTAVAEGGAADSYTLVLTSQPTADVVISVGSGSQATAGPSSVTFTPTNWFLPQTITVTAVDDAVAEGSHGDTVMHVAASSDADYNGIAVASVAVAITDNETAGIVVTESGGSTAVAEGGATDTYTLVLTSEPTADVTIAVNGDADASGSPASLTFTPANWSMAQTVTVAAADDEIAEGAHTGTLAHAASSADPAYNGIAAASVTAAITDNDSAAVTVTESGGSTAVAEGGATDTYELVLTSEPTADVTITVTGDADVTGTPGSLTFTAANWNVAQTVTVGAVNDSIAEGAHSGTLTHAATSADATYSGIAVAPVTASVTDNDTAGVTVTQTGGSTAVAEGGTTDSYTLVLRSQPTASVTVAVSAGGQLTANPASVTFTTANWSVPQSVTLAAVNDVSAEGTQVVSVTHSASSADGGYSGVAVASVSVTIFDNDVAGVVVAESGGATAVSEGGPTDTLAVTLATQPTSDVTITLDPGTQLTATPATLTFTPANYATPQTVTVGAVDDAVVEGTHVADLGGTVTSPDPNYSGSLGTIAVTITDNDDAVPGTVVVTPSGNVVSPGGGGAFSWSGLLGLLALAALRRRTLAAAALALASTAALAQTGAAGTPAVQPSKAMAKPAARPVAGKLSYNSAELRYVSVSVDEPSVDAGGFTLAGSWAVGKSLYLLAGYSAIETDKFRLQGAVGSTETTTLGLGLGLHYPLKPGVDVTAALNLLSAESEASGGFSGSSDDTGFGLDAGLRGYFARDFEWGLGASWVSIFDDDDTALTGQTQWHVGTNFGVLAGVGFGSNSSQLSIGVRYNF